MYIDPFIAGILITLFVEISFVLIFAIQHLHKIDDDENCVHVELTKEEMEQIMENLKGVVENVKDNDNQGEQ